MIISHLDLHPLRQLHLLAAEGFDDDEAEAGERNHHDEEDRQGDDDRRGFAELGEGDLGERLAAAPHRRRQHEHVLHRAGQTDADDEPEQAGHVAVLDRQHGADERAGAGDSREVMAEQDPLVGRMVVLPIVEFVRGRLLEIVEHRHLRGQEGAVVAIRDGEDAQDAQQERHGAQDGVAVDFGGEEIGEKRHDSLLALGVSYLNKISRKDAKTQRRLQTGTLRTTHFAALRLCVRSV